MSALTRILSGLALAGALSVPTFAATGPQQGDSLPNGSMLIIWPDGTMARVHIIDSSAARLGDAASHASHSANNSDRGEWSRLPGSRQADGKRQDDVRRHVGHL